MGNRKSTFLITNLPNSSTAETNVSVPQISYSAIQNDLNNRIQSAASCRNGRRTGVLPVKPGLGYNIEQDFEYEFANNDLAQDYEDDIEMRETVFNRAVNNLLYSIPGGAPFEVQFAGSFLGNGILKVDINRKLLIADNWIHTSLINIQQNNLNINGSQFTMKVENNNKGILGYINNNNTGINSSLPKFVFTNSKFSIQGRLNYNILNNLPNSITYDWPNIQNGDIHIESEDGKMELKTFDNGNIKFREEPEVSNGLMVCEVDKKTGVIRIKSENIVLKIGNFYYLWPQKKPFYDGDLLALDKTNKDGTINDPFKLYWKKTIIIYNDEYNNA